MPAESSRVNIAPLFREHWSDPLLNIIHETWDIKMPDVKGFSVSAAHFAFDFLKSCLRSVLLCFLVHHTALTVCSSALCQSYSQHCYDRAGWYVCSPDSAASVQCFSTSAVAFQCSGQLLSDLRHFSTSDNSRSDALPASDLIRTACHAEPHGKHRRPPHTRWFTECQSAASTLHTGKIEGSKELLTMLWMKSGIWHFIFNHTYYQCFFNA